ncbi:uncharacterized protein TRIADDRAFT_34177, partial [Trichoplax adhaerens]
CTVYTLYSEYCTAVLRTILLLIEYCTAVLRTILLLIDTVYCTVRHLCTVRGVLYCTTDGYCTLYSIYYTFVLYVEYCTVDRLMGTVHCTVYISGQFELMIDDDTI